MKITSLSNTQLSDHRYRVSLMDAAADYPEMLAGTNEDGETVTVEICSDFISVCTSQSNGWHRTNVYHRDGTTEELYER